MQDCAWETLLRHVPAEVQNQFMIVTASGTEIAVQNFLRIERELIVFKGRLSGSQEQGLLFFVPYGQIAYFGTAKPWKDTEYEETFASLKFPVAPRPSGQGLPPLAEPALPETVEMAAEKPPASAPVIRSQVLERFRSRGGNS